MISYAISGKFETKTGFEMPVEETVRNSKDNLDPEGEWIDEVLVPEKLPKCLGYSEVYRRQP